MLAAVCVIHRFPANNNNYGHNTNVDEIYFICASQKQDS